MDLTFLMGEGMSSSKKLIAGCFAFVFLAMATGFLPGQDAKPANPKPLDPFQGSWQLEKVEADGNQLPPDLFGAANLEIKGNEYTLTKTSGNKVAVKGKLATSDEKTLAKDPKGPDLIAIDITPEADGKPLDPQKGIFALVSGKLHLCSGPPGAARPNSLSTQGREAVTLMVFNRKKP